MDFHSLKRRDLQTLCKKNDIPANMTNAAMADALASLDTVEGVEEFFKQSESGGLDSPERSVITSPNLPRTSTRQRPCKEEVECSKLATRTRCGSRRRTVEQTDTKPTPATRTTRRRAPQEASAQRKTKTDLQAEFETDLQESEVSENNGLFPGGGGESTEVLEVSGLMDQEGHVTSESQSEPQDHEYDQQQHMEEHHLMSEAREVSSDEMLNGGRNVDFHNLSRKELQNLCKKNKIPANITNAAMADALEALERVEGLEDLLNECYLLVPKSPETSQMTSSRVRKTRTTQKTTRRKPAQAGSALGKVEYLQTQENDVVQSLGKKIELCIEAIERPVSVSTAMDVLSKDMGNDLQCHLESCLKKPEVLDYVSEEISGNKSESESLPEEVSDESDVSVLSETGKEPQIDVVESRLDEGKDEGIETEVRGSSAKLLSNLKESNIDDGLKSVSDQYRDFLGQKETNFSEIDDTLQEDASLNEGDEHVAKTNYCESEPLSEEVSDESDISAVLETGKGEPQIDMGENRFDEGKEEGIEAEICDSGAELVEEGIEAEVCDSGAKLVSNIEDGSKPVSDQLPADALGQKETKFSEIDDALEEDALQKEGDEQEVQVNYCEESDNSTGLEIGVMSSDEPTFGECEGLMQEIPGGDDGSNEFDNIVSDDGLYMENLKQLGEAPNEIGGVVFEDASVVYSNAPEDVSDLANVERGSESMSNSATQGEGLVLGSAAVQFSMEAQEINADGKLDNCDKEVDKLVSTFDAAVKCPVEKVHAENQVNRGVRFSNEVGELNSSEINADNKFKNCQKEVDQLINTSDAAVDICPVERVHAEDKMTKKFYSESTTEVDEHAAKGTPLYHKSLRKLKRMLKERLQATDLLAKKMEKLSLENNADAELTNEVPENLEEGCDEFEATGGHSIIAVSGVGDAPVSAVNDDQNEESTENNIETIKSDDKGEIASIFKEETSDHIDRNLATNSIVHAAAQCDVHMLLDNETCEDFVVGRINVESVNYDSSDAKLQTAAEQNEEGEKQSIEVAARKQVGVTKSDDISCSLFTPKSSRKTPKPMLTPGKCSSKTSTSVGRTNLVLNINKENVDYSANKTGAGKVEIAVTGSGKLFSAASMGKLKKELKALQQQSEKKRPALQSRLENQCSLASP